MAHSKILLKRSDIYAVVPELDHGELAINYRDGHLFYKDVDDVVRPLPTMQPQDCPVSDLNGTFHSGVYRTDNQTNSASPAISLLLNLVRGSSRSFQLETDDVNNSLFIRNKNTTWSPWRRVALFSGENFGIGTHTPNDKLTIVQTAAAKPLRIYSTADGNGRMIEFEQAASSNASAAMFSLINGDGSLVMGSHGAHYTVIPIWTNRGRIESQHPGGMALTTHGNSPIVVGPNRAERFRVDSDGAQVVGRWRSQSNVISRDGSTLTFNPNNGNIQMITLDAHVTAAFANFSNGDSIMLMVHPGTGSINWQTTVTWLTGTAPTLISGKFNGIILWRAGDVTYGAKVGD